MTKRRLYKRRVRIVRCTRKSVWIEYERRKKGLGSVKHEAEIRKLAEVLGI